MAVFAGEQRRGGRNRRGGADRDMTDVADQPVDHVGEQFLIAEFYCRRHARA